MRSASALLAALAAASTAHALNRPKFYFPRELFKDAGVTNDVVDGAANVKVITISSTVTVAPPDATPAALNFAVKNFNSTSTSPVTTEWTKTFTPATFTSPMSSDDFVSSLLNDISSAWASKTLAVPIADSSSSSPSSTTPSTTPSAAATTPSETPQAAIPNETNSISVSTTADAAKEPSTTPIASPTLHSSVASDSANNAPSGSSNKAPEPTFTSSESSTSLASSTTPTGASASSSGILLAPTGVVSSQADGGGLLGGITSVVGGIGAGVTSLLAGPTANASDGAGASATSTASAAPPLLSIGLGGGDASSYPGTAPTAASTSNAPILSIGLGGGADSTTYPGTAPSSTTTPPPLLSIGLGGGGADSSSYPGTAPSNSASPPLLSIGLGGPGTGASSGSTTATASGTPPLISIGLGGGSDSSSKPIGNGTSITVSAGPQPTPPVNGTSGPTGVSGGITWSTPVSTPPQNGTHLSPPPVSMTAPPANTTTAVPVTVPSTTYSVEQTPTLTTVTATAPGVTSIVPTATFTTSSQGYIASTVVIAQPPSTTATSGSATASVTGLPSNLPKGITPSNGNATPLDSRNMTLIQIAFLFGYNFEWVSSNSKASGQLFELVPKALAYNNLDSSTLNCQKLVPIDSHSRLDYIITSAQCWYPTTMVSSLAEDVALPNSVFYKSNDTLIYNLTQQVNPAISIIIGSGYDDGWTPGSGSGGSGSGSSNNGDPFSNNGGTDESGSRPSGKQRGIQIGIGLGAAAVAGAYGAVMFIVARRYKKKKQAHRRASSITNPSDMRQTGSPALMGGALLSRDFTGYGSVPGGRDSHGSGRSGAGNSARTAQISAPVAAENSLGWN